MTAHLPHDPEQTEHIPVLLQEVVEGLQIEPGAVVIDGTLGGGGHAEQMLAAAGSQGRLLGLDADPAAIRRIRRRLAQEIESGRLLVEQAFFEEIGAVATRHQMEAVDAIMLDLGVSSFQLETPERGFSLLNSGRLDMRFDPQQGFGADEIVNQWPEDEIADILYRYGEEKRSRRIARAMVKQRPIHDTAQLAQIVEQALGGRRGQRIHPATRTFQALRIAVNDELGRLERTLPHCLSLLRSGGRLAVISFHSLEDRIVKQWMQAEARDFAPDPRHPYGGIKRTPQLEIVTRRPIVASPEEIARNPRSRSAKLRIAQRIVT